MKIKHMLLSAVAVAALIGCGESDVTNFTLTSENITNDILDHNSTQVATKDKNMSPHLE